MERALVNPLEPSHGLSQKRDVSIHVTFIKIGEIDTLRECFEAVILLRSKWREPELDGRQIASSTEFLHLWNPHIFIENAIGEPKVRVRQRLETNEAGHTFVVERRWITGKFMEQLELWYFPFDVQDLSISIMCESDAEVDMIEDADEVHRVYKQSFIDEQEWYLYKYIESVHSDTELDIEDIGDATSKKWTLTVRCRAARRSAYFVWNIFSVTFLLCCLALATFAVTPVKTENRLQLSFTLVLTAVTFKFVVNQSLPKISYLTYLDRYVLGTLIMLALVCCWHASVSMVTEDIEHQVDNIGVMCFGSIYTLYNAGFWINIYLKPFNKRRRMKLKESEYTSTVMKESYSRSFKNNPADLSATLEIDSLLHSTDKIKPLPIRE